ncbi:hypothetical protein CFRA_04880 [Corynebacterium frankenforstense DSM 45800]|uniref:DUF4192 domain-containing protein n=1 Tax=Corynebacterium frankenforstense DSM 45800 TaxID=1437875 RepID=A0A1L7CS87_9CORY|nr:DUF4192 domain-containing protein [Corynebacterium frankenforstense]APT88702.1 hypothetical protein CFRA_04880 [Corynebacterium frankenforstense DSM 45800]
MTDSTEHTLHTPGDLIANLPAVFGFFPEDSLVLAAFLDDGVRFALGPVLRVDLRPVDAEAVESALGSLGAYRAGDGRVIAAFVITADAAERDRVCELLFAASRAGDVDLLGCWSAEGVLAGGSYELEFCPPGAEPLDDWYGGRIPEVVAAAAMAPLLRRGELPEPDREAALEFFAPLAGREIDDVAPGAAAGTRAVGAVAGTRAVGGGAPVAGPAGVLDDVVLAAAAERARGLAAAMRRGGAAGRAAYGAVVGAAERALDAVSQGRGLVRGSFFEDLVCLAGALGETHLRDAVAATVLDHPEAAERVLAVLVRVLSGEARANALCLYSLVAGPAGHGHRVAAALAVARTEFPAHRLTRLLSEAQLRCGPEVVAERVRRGSRQVAERLGVAGADPAGGIDGLAA